jgi:hypothetical protein
LETKAGRVDGGGKLWVLGEVERWALLLLDVVGVFRFV